MKIEPGEIVIVVLHTPREKVLGVLEEIGTSGVHTRGIELGYFDDWTRAINAGEPHLPMTDHFFPMWRIERISLDASSDDMRSMAQQFYERTGKEIGQF